MIGFNSFKSFCPFSSTKKTFSFSLLLHHHPCVTSRTSISIPQRLQRHLHFRRTVNNYLTAHSAHAAIVSKSQALFNHFVHGAIVFNTKELSATQIRCQQHRQKTNVHSFGVFVLRLSNQLSTTTFTLSVLNNTHPRPPTLLLSNTHLRPPTLPLSNSLSLTPLSSPSCY